jgi:hypothetical protein
MESAPACSLDAPGLIAQRERYRELGRGARLIERTSARLVVELYEGLDTGLLEQTLAIERECCPFFELRWESATRRLEVSVAAAAHAPALDAIAHSLGTAV